MTLLRTSTLDDRPAILSVVRAAFDGGKDETDIVEKVWSSTGYRPDLDVVAEQDEQVVGHVLCSTGSVDGRQALGLAPLAVRPQWHGRGIGSALMREVIARAETAGDRVILLLGHTGYYPRFGFRPARDVGITYLPDPAPEPDPFMALTLSAWDPGIRGRFTYAWE